MEGPSNVTFVSPAVMRYVSLQAASQGDKVSLAADVASDGTYRVWGQTVTRADTDNDKWRMLQAVEGSGGQQSFYMYHCATGLCLARDPHGQLTLTPQATLQRIDPLTLDIPPSTSGWYGLWAARGDERGIYVIAPDVVKPDAAGKYCVATDGTVGAACTGSCSGGATCQAVTDFCLVGGRKKKPGLRADGSAADPSIASKCGFCGYPGSAFGGNPIGGSVYVVLGAKVPGGYQVTAGPPAAASIGDMICTGVVQTGDKSHAWYMLPQRDPSNAKFQVPVRSGMSLGEFFSWSPDQDVNAPFCVSHEPLAARFVDPATQTVPRQSQYPTMTAQTQDPDARDALVQRTSRQLFQRTTTINWQYLDIYACFAGDQGFAPDEFRKIGVDGMGVGGDLKLVGPGPVSGAADGPYYNNTDNLYAYIDGSKAAGNGGRVTIPPKWMIDACHKNGVKCFGCMFFQEIYYGGKYGWWVQFTQDPELSARRLVDIALYYGFDGWNFNLETGAPDKPLMNGYPGQIYRGVNQYTGAPADEYWCNAMSGAKYPTWWVNQGNQAAMDYECGNADHWPCACTNPNQPSWPAPDFDPNAGKPATSEACAAASNDYRSACNEGWTLRENMKKVIKAFNAYRDSKKAAVQLFIYDTIQVTSPYGVGISTVDPDLCPDGVSNTGQCFGNSDFWYDKDGPVVDYVYDMRSGLGGSESSTSPRGTTSTYILSKNNAEAVGAATLQGWPKDTGPTAGGTYCPAVDAAVLGKDCTDNADACTGGTMCAPFDTEHAKSYCVPGLFTGYACNNGHAPAEAANLPLDRPYHYFQAIQLEGFSGPSGPAAVDHKRTVPTTTVAAFGTALAANAAGGNDQGWDSAIYCGTQSANLAKGGYGGAAGSCVNEEAAVERPLGSLHVYYIDVVWRWFSSFSSVPGYPVPQAVVDWVVQNQLTYYTGARFLTPSNRVDTGTLATYWKGLAHFVAERSVIQTYPFRTCFSIGAGTDVWLAGSAQGYGQWNNWSMQSVLPTWMWWPDDPVAAAFVRIGFDVTDAWERSNSLCFRTTTDPGWMRYDSACNAVAPPSTRSDCGIGDKPGCLAAGCCFDDSRPDSGPWCYHKTGGAPPSPAGKTATVAYRLFKTKLPLARGCAVHVRYKLTGANVGLAGLSIGYSTSAAPDRPVWATVPAGGSGWQTFATAVPSSSGYMATIWARVVLPRDYDTAIRLGEISVLDAPLPVAPPRVATTESASYVTTVTKRRACVLDWAAVAGVEYYNVWADGRLLDQLYHGPGGGQVHYKVLDVSPTATLSVTPGGSPVRPAPPAPTADGDSTALMIGGIVSTVVLAGGIAATGASWRKLGVHKKQVGMIVGLVIVPMVAVIVLWIYYSEARAPRPVRALAPARGAATTAALAAVGVAPRVEMWQGAKPHAFNACFDDAHVKCWKWMVDMSKRKKWPIKFTFFYNTLWVTRDYYMLKDWIALGHEIASHGHDHDCLCDTTNYTEQQLVDNWVVCANLIRKLYDQPDRELMTAWPHGAYPLIPDDPKSCIAPESPCPGTNPPNYDCQRNCDPGPGTPRTKILEMLDKYYIGGRSTQVDLINTWPNPAALTGTYPNPDWALQMSPKWAYPYQIDINPPDDTDPAGLCAGYLRQLDRALAVPNGMVVVAGHDFAPTDAQGNDVPCSWSTIGGLPPPPGQDGWCSDPNDCEKTFVCPESVRDVTEGCYTNPPGTPGPLPVPLYQPSGALADPAFPPSRANQLVKPTASATADGDHGPGVVDCNQCCDACWSPVPGSCLIALFDRVTERQDLFWFATYTEILQYMHNRDNVRLEFTRDQQTVTVTVTPTASMLDIPLTLSLGSRAPRIVSVDGKPTTVGVTPDGNHIVQCQPRGTTPSTVRATY
jgi:endo-beta-N-acetylglucosaminidase D